ncbi:MAG: APC family permease [Thermoleophilia bacterium]|nr:APC family permease [Thermoleophilia bacterium]
MSATDAGQLRKGAIGLPQVVFQSVTHMAPAAAVAFSLYASVTFAGPALPLAVLLALIACVLAASCIGQLAKEVPSAGGLYAYVAKGLGPAPGFFVGWGYLLFQPLVAPLLFLIFAWVMGDLMTAEEHGFGASNSLWWLWVILAAGIVFLLTYRDVRLSTKAGVWLGVIEIVVFLALALWMIVSNLGDLTLQTLNPAHNPVAGIEGTFKGMIFAVLAFIGFEASAPLAEEAKDPRRTIPRAVVGSALAIGLFYWIASYGWVLGTGFGSFTETVTNAANPWKDLGVVFWGVGWVLIVFAILNSAIANANAGVNAATRVMFALGRNGVLPSAFARVHPEHKTPHIATIVVSGGGLVLALVMGVIWDPLTAFIIIATAVTIVVIVMYILACIACAVYYFTQKRSAFNPLLHGVFPLVATAVFTCGLYFQFFTGWFTLALPPYPTRIATWVALGWIVAGVLLAAYMSVKRRSVLENAGNVFVDESS